VLNACGFLPGASALQHCSVKLGDQVIGQRSQHTGWGQETKRRSQSGVTKAKRNWSVTRPSFFALFRKRASKMNPAFSSTRQDAAFDANGRAKTRVSAGAGSLAPAHGLRLQLSLSYLYLLAGLAFCAR